MNKVQGDQVVNELREAPYCRGGAKSLRTLVLFHGDGSIRLGGPQDMLRESGSDDDIAARGRARTTRRRR